MSRLAAIFKCKHIPTPEIPIKSAKTEHLFYLHFVVKMQVVTYFYSLTAYAIGCNRGIVSALSSTTAFIDDILLLLLMCNFDLIGI